MDSLLIRNARLIDSTRDFNGDLLIVNGKIGSLGKDISGSAPEGCSIIDGEGLALMPSFTDLHCHFRDPGFTYKEDILSGSKAAVRGGYTSINLMPNTRPVCSSMGVVDYVLTKAKEYGLVDVHQSVSITKDFSGESIAHLESLKPYVKFISEDGFGVDSDAVMLKAMMKAKELGLGVMSHCENRALSKEDMRLAEDVETIRNVGLARYTGCRLHVCHVSTEYSLKEILRSKKDGAKVTCEVTPHHIALTEGTKYRVNPPLRKKSDVEAIIEGIREGWIDAIATDHAPHTHEDKEGGAPGMVGLETAFSVCYTELVKKGHISLGRLVQLMSERPSAILGIEKGTLIIGRNADLVLVDLDKEITIDSRCFASKGKNTPFDGRKYFGEVITTIKGGKAVYMKEDCSL